MNMIRVLKSGLLSMADVYVEPRSYIYRTGGGFARDNAKLAGDVKRVGEDMNKIISTHGKQSDERRSTKR